VTRHPIPLIDPYRLQLESFAAAVRGAAPPKPPLVDSVVNAVTLDALLTSAAERTAIAIELPAPVRVGAPVS
jgi:hypothetical protein